MSDPDLQLKIIKHMQLLPWYSAFGWGLVALFMLIGVILGKEAALYGAAIMCVGWVFGTILTNFIHSIIFFVARRLARQDAENRDPTLRNKEDK